jgi:small conductance mechanosensitive channel
MAAETSAMTTANPEIPVDDLALLVKPLTLDDLIAEADGWQDMVRAKAEEIAAAEIAAQQRGREGGSAAEGEEAGQKETMVAKLVALRAQRTALVDRTRVVLKSIERKGGEIEAYDKYLAAVSGIRVDVTDASATWVTMTSWLTSEEGGIRWGLNLLQFFLTLLLFLGLGRLSGKMMSRMVARARLSDLMRDFAVTGANRTVVAIGVLMALSALEVNVGPVLAVLGAAGFVVAFALQSTLGNFASGIMILIYRPFDIGDVIDAAGVLGKVVSMNLVSTTITTPDNKVVIVPNNEIWGNVITNVTGRPTRRVDLVFGIGYADDIAKAQSIIEESVRAHPKVLEDPPPVIKVHELGDSSVNFVCRPWARTVDYWDVYWDLTRSMKEAFDENDVTIPFPQRDVHVHRDAQI